MCFILVNGFDGLLFGLYCLFLYNLLKKAQLLVLLTVFLK